MLGRQTLLRYLLRPPIAQQRLKLEPSGLVRTELRRPFADGTVAVEMDPLSLLCRLAAAVPPPRMHTVRYAGVLAPASKWRPLIVPPAPAADQDAPEPSAGLSDQLATSPPASTRPADSNGVGSCCLAFASASASACTTPRKPTHRSRWRPWALLLARTFQAELGYCRCGGMMKLRAIVTEPRSVRRILQHLGEPTDPPARAPARSPPFFQTGPLRRRLRAAEAQVPMFEG